VSNHRCLRCKTPSLVESEHHHPDIRFFECPKCERCYALQPGQHLTFRWMHPITLVLYRVIFDAAPVERAGIVAKKFAQYYSREKQISMIEEIRLELADPTQQVRDSLDCRASEEDLREYLRSFCECLEHLRANPD
jgi:hypothetical protein